MANDDVDENWDPETGDTDEDGQPDWNVESDDAGGFDQHIGDEGGFDAGSGLGGEGGFDWRAELENHLPSDEEATLDRVHRVSELLDEAIPVPGTDYRIGLDPVLGILPVAGDSIAMVISLYIVGEAARAGVSRSTLATMVGLVMIDAVIGSIPVLGTIFDAVWKANVWNVKLLEKELDAQ